MSAAILMSAASCTKCAKKDDVKCDDSVKVEMVVENVVSTDKESMFVNYKDDYRWFETCVVLNDYLDGENCDGSPETIKNIFQYVSDRGNDSYDVRVVMFTHMQDTTFNEVVEGFWVEDYPLTENDVKLTYKEAYEKLMATNITKPHSRQCVLRKQIGPKDANAQYIFGNIRSQVYVDAITGEVSDKNPAFDTPEGFKMPLGEWP